MALFIIFGMIGMEFAPKEVSCQPKGLGRHPPGAKDRPQMNVLSVLKFIG